MFALLCTYIVLAGGLGVRLRICEVGKDGVVRYDTPLGDGRGEKAGWLWSVGICSIGDGMIESLITVSTAILLSD